MMELLILYVLSKKELTMYAISKAIMDNFATYTQPSFGAIKPALTRLEKENFIQSRKAISDGGKLSGYYSLTRNGQIELKRLLLSKITNNPLQFNSTSRIKLCCAGYLSNEERNDLFFQIKSKAQEHKFIAEKILEDNTNSLSFYQKIILDNTICEYKNFISLIESLEKENARNSQ